jgi:hypothetical protein
MLLLEILILRAFTIRGPLPVHSLHPSPSPSLFFNKVLIVSPLSISYSLWKSISSLLFFNEFPYQSTSYITQSYL